MMLEAIALGTVTLLESLDSTVATGAFVVGMIVLFLVALVAIQRRRAAAFYQATPTLLTTLGILGTFLGIAIGLLDFDSSRIEQSIPLLLDGLKLAFTTSIVGILLSAALRLVLVLGKDGKPRQGTSGAETAASEGVEILTLIDRQTLLADAQLTATLQLTEQLGRMDERLIQTLEGQHRAHLAALDRFGETLSDMGSRHLITALESVIRDFNANLGEQFGENFRRLDASVAKLLDWQEQYRRHMEGLGQQLDQAIAGVAQSQTSLEALTQQARQISTHVEDQQSAVKTLRRETLELEALLGSIAELRDKAKEAFPAIDQRLSLMLESIEGAILSGLSTQQRLNQLAMDGRPFGHAPHDLAARAQV